MLVHLVSLFKFFFFSVCGSHSSIEWESEGRRVVPLMPRLVPQTVFTGTATAAANQASKLNAASSTAKGCYLLNYIHHVDDYHQNMNTCEIWPAFHLLFTLTIHLYNVFIEKRNNLLFILNFLSFIICKL